MPVVLVLAVVVPPVVEDDVAAPVELAAAPVPPDCALATCGGAGILVGGAGGLNFQTTLPSGSLP